MADDRARASFLFGAGARTLLDAGTGNGYFARRAAALGYTVDAVDFSDVAISEGRAGDSSVRQWYVGALADFTAGEPYDVVICIDVLFHVVDDELWRRSIRNLARLTAPAGTLLIQESLVLAPIRSDDATGLRGSQHTRWRTLDGYLVQLQGWRLVEHIRYTLPSENVEKDLLVLHRSDDASSRAHRLAA